MCIQADWDEVNENILRAGVGSSAKSKATTTTKKQKTSNDEDMDIDTDVDVDGEKENDGVNVTDAVRGARELLEAAVRVEEGEEEIL